MARVASVGGVVSGGSFAITNRRPLGSQGSGGGAAAGQLDFSSASQSGLFLILRRGF